ncbi:formimidoylglutamate deiminase [Asticcacaulis taihuensis]|uniref:formimidoylglutamate deiminase n=1 Tax=Asticcacaulis taihuensis TaxID=260084 RepID=UPI003F7C145A
MSSLWFEKALLKSGWQSNVLLTIENGRIASIETDAAPQGERHGIGVPGMPNLHSHAFQRVIAGLTERRSGEQDSFWSWREQMYKFQARIGPEELQTIAALAYMEMLEAGFTRVGEFHYLHHDIDGRPFADLAEMGGRILAAAEATGIGLTLLPVFYAHSGFGGLPPTPGQVRFIHDLDGFQRLLDASHGHAARLDDAVVGIAPHSLRAVTPEELTALVPMAQGGPIHIHIAEQVKEVEDCLAHTGQRPAEWLFDHAPVDDQWCLVHATHMTAEEMTRLAKSGAIAGLCPITEANLGDGLFPARDYLKQGGRFGIGSDSNVLISVAEELRLLEYGQRLIHRERNVLDNLYVRALDGAQALGVQSGIAIGEPADIVSLDCDLDSFVFASARSPIDCVWRFGRKQVSGGRHVKRDALLADYRRLMQRLTA